MFKTFLTKIVLSKISNAIIFLGDLATAKSCILFFNEIEIPEKLKKEAKF